MNNKRAKGFFLLTALIILTVGCSPQFRNMNPVHSTPAAITYVTSVHKELISLPEPKEKIVIAVYKFRDQTGQYKASATGMTWSTAVTQGATSMLLKSLEDSGWFIVVEREGISNLLNERKIITATRDNYTDDQGNKLPPLPPLLYAGVTLEGGIISYETNTLTGGFGARYFGLGGHTEFRSDQVNIYLRTVATKTGRILNNVTTTKTILSKAVDFSLYRFIREKRLLEIESGYSTNEPPQMCVLEAIEKGVLSLICEGIITKNWELKNPEDIKSPIIQNYLVEKENSERYSAFGQEQTAFNEAPAFGYDKGLAFSLNFSSQLYQGDYANPRLRPGGDVTISYGLHPRFALALNASAGRLANRDNFYTDLALAQLQGFYNMWPKSSLRPFVYAGGGVMNFKVRDKAGEQISREKRFNGWEPVIAGGAGLECFVSRQVSFNFLFENQYTFTDYMDGILHGKLDDYFWSFKFGIKYY
ncbi:MAG TPA: CsgG/HfaB family protein [bacterium]|nr:CsgG/HfaB family protein [bacterium]HPN45153.1 CsgG/HfaB family protein [bacterium]